MTSFVDFFQSDNLAYCFRSGLSDLNRIKSRGGWLMQRERIQRQRKPADQAGSSFETQPQLDKSLQRGGQPLDAVARNFLEPKFGHNLDSVRIFTDDWATGITSSFGARALSVGSDIAFAPGQYNHQSSRGMQVLAHELAHVVQYERFGGNPTTLEQRSTPGDVAEVSAHSAARDVLSGQSTSISTNPTAVVSTWGWLDDAVDGVGSLVQQGQRLGRAAWQEGVGSLASDYSGAMDRQLAQEELDDRFNIIDNDYVGPLMPNQVTQSEFQDVARTYSDIRSGRGDLTVDASELGNDSTGSFGMTEEDYRSLAMNDLATIMTTPTGRREVMGLSNNVLRDDAGNVRNTDRLGFGLELPQTTDDLDGTYGDPIHHHTTIRPFHQDTNDDGDRSNDNDAELDDTNAIADWGQNEEDTFRQTDGSRGRGSNVDLRINPGMPLTGHTTPSDVIMAHEMAHALHETQGSMAPSTYVTSADGVLEDVGKPISEFEHQAAGLGRHSFDTNTENAYRLERMSLDESITKRFSYSNLP
jgi:predicted SprT family Zn-dependent metalloprotease